MKAIIGHDLGTYSFNKTTKQVTISGLSTLTLDNIVLITNQTDGIIMYNFADPTLKGTISGNVITLDYDTSSMDNGDTLQIIIDTIYPIPQLRPCAAEYTSPTDFTATFATGTTLTLSGLPITIIDNSQLAYVVVTPASGKTKIYENGINCKLTISGATLTIANTNVLTPFVTGDTYELGINGVRKAYDPSLDVIKTMDQAPLWARYTDPEALLSAAQNVTASFADCGPEVNVRGFNKALFYVTLDINDAVNFRFKMLAKHTSAGSEEYPLSSVKWRTVANSTYVAAAASMYYEIDDDADQLFVIEVDVDSTMAFLQLQITAETVGATAGQVDALYVMKGYK